LEADEFRLIAALKESVDPGFFTNEFRDLSESNNAPTFTQLWLDDMQSFRRNRIDELQVETKLQDGKYTIKEKIATGGQAKIYSAVDNETNQPVAVKELVLPVHAGAEVRNRAFTNVKNEAMMLGTLDHPGIVKLLDNFVEDHRAYLVLEHISGRTLRKMVQDDGPFATGEIVSIALQICDVLRYLHGQSPPVVHRDLTPDNLMLSVDGEKRVRLLDFNVAQQLESNSTKTVVGKHNYMAPEQFKGKPCTQSDLYSLGCTLFFLFTGTDPLPLAASRPSTRCASAPAATDDLIFNLTQPQMADRYQDVDAVIADLKAV
jgi:serine/threonine-protein kinase